MAVTDIVLTPIRKSWITFCDILTYLSGEGDWKLRPLHQAVIDRLLTYLDAATSSKIRSQLDQNYFMQFMPDGRINTFFFNNLPDHLLITDPTFQHCLFKVEIIADGRKQHGQVIFYGGRIFSVEFKKPHKFFADKDIKIGAVISGKSKDTFTAVLDRAEHGRETGHNP